MMRIRLTALFIGILFIFSGAGCGLLPELPKDIAPQEEAESDDLEYPVSVAGITVESRPGIVVSLAPSITEKMFDMGLADRLEGISDYCDESDNYSRTRCGWAMEPDIEVINELMPHLIITDAAIPDEYYSELTQRGAQIAVIPRAATVEQLKQNYDALARLLEGDKSGVALGDAFSQKFQTRLDEVTQNTGDETKNAVYIGELDYEVATGDTLESVLMEMVGIYNIAKDQTGWIYPEDEANSDEGLKSFESIDFIFCDKRHVTIKDMEQSAFYKGLDAVRKDRYLYIDRSAFECQTYRMLDELDRMKKYANGEIPGSKDEPEPVPEQQAEPEQAA